MKKIFKLMTIALVAMCGFTACDNDCEHDFIEHDFSKALVGTWTCLDEDFAEAMVIKADGSVEVTGLVDGEYFHSKGTIKVVNNKMIYKLDNGDEWEGRFEMTTGESFTMVLSEELDVRYTYRYCENDLADEVVGMWICNNGPLEGIQTFKTDGTSIMTGMTPVGGVLNHESTYKVIGDLMFCMMPEGYDLRYSCARIVYRPNGTALGDVMIHQSINVTDDFEIEESSLTWLRVKEGLNLTGKTYDYNSAYVSNAKGIDEDFSILRHTFNMANINAGNFDMMFRSELFCVDLNTNTITQHFLPANGQDVAIKIPTTVEGNKVTLDYSAVTSGLRKVDMYMFQDADDSQLHMYMHTDAFINYFANLEVATMLQAGEINSTDAAAVEKVYTDMKSRIESINVSFVFKARK